MLLCASPAPPLLYLITPIDDTPDEAVPPSLYFARFPPEENTPDTPATLVASVLHCIVIVPVRAGNCAAVSVLVRAPSLAPSVKLASQTTTSL